MGVIRTIRRAVALVLAEDRGAALTRVRRVEQCSRLAMSDGGLRAPHAGERRRHPRASVLTSAAVTGWGERSDGVAVGAILLGLCIAVVGALPEIGQIFRESGPASMAEAMSPIGVVAMLLLPFRVPGLLALWPVGSLLLRPRTSAAARSATASGAALAMEWVATGGRAWPLGVAASLHLFAGLRKLAGARERESVQLWRPSVVLVLAAATILGVVLLRLWPYCASLTTEQLVGAIVLPSIALLVPTAALLWSATAQAAHRVLRSAQVGLMEAIATGVLLASINVGPFIGWGLVSLLLVPSALMVVMALRWVRVFGATEHPSAVVVPPGSTFA